MTTPNPGPWSNDLESVLNRIHNGTPADRQEAAKRCAKIVADKIREEAEKAAEACTPNADPISDEQRQWLHDYQAAKIFEREGLDFFLDVTEAEAQADPKSGAHRGRHAVPWNKVSRATEEAEAVGMLTWSPPARVF